MASKLVVAGLHDVGLVMNGTTAPGGVPNRVSVVDVIWIGAVSGPMVAVLGWLSTGDSMPKSVDVRRLIGDLRKIALPPDGRTMMPSTAGCVPSDTRL